MQLSSRFVSFPRKLDNSLAGGSMFAKLIVIREYICIVA